MIRRHMGSCFAQFETSARGRPSNAVVTTRGIRTKIEIDPARPRIIKTEPGVGYRLADAT